MNSGTRSIGQPLKLKNNNCCYCGNILNDGDISIDHVIGRKFVPTGSLENQWNLHCRACKICNNKKSDLEDDISTLSMIFACISQDANNEASLVESTARKLKGSLSRKTGRPHKDSYEHFSVSASSGGISIKSEISGPPRLDARRIGSLALLHYKAFYFLRTYDTATRLGFLPAHPLSVLPPLPRSDWGAAHAISFIKTIEPWDTDLFCITAN